ncbi:EAL domain-containing protein [Kamptonema sp. UHCC 0994]|uniref:EAL domain-containing protein n=1 Tax=Kamptonema sp. UHCC 0994 TaxID=3031329 RepID=UPI0023B93633|nr:EAL domain-containing protein [Kamptonema sp. UHCC 0994]MDF0555763.1 EAL domain-containing protein [Kamptonema sp. UHCC 0994]
MFQQSYTQPQQLKQLQHSPLHLLIVEDVVEDAELMAIALESAGVNFTWNRAQTARDCEDLLTNTTYDAVLSDYRLPGFNGLEVFKLVQQSGQEIPFILVTGSLGEEAAVECIKAGMTDYVLKDRLFRLPTVLERALGEFKLRRQQEQAIALVQRQAKREAIINKIVQAMRSTLALDEVMQITVDQLQTALQTTRCLICQVEINNQTRACYVSLTATNRENIIGVQCGFSRVHYQTLSQGETVIVSDFSNLPPQIQELLRIFEVRSLAIIPLLYRDSFLGVISLHQCDRPREWSPEELSLVNVIADQCAIAIHQAELYQKAQTELTERKRAEEALRQREQRFRSLIENATDITVILNASGKYDYISPSVKRILGYSPEIAIGRNALSLAHPDDTAAIAQTLSKAIQNPGISQSPIEYRVRHRTGSWCVLEAVATNLLHDPTVNGIVVNCHDITARKLAEQQLLHDAFHDGLTGLANRALFSERLDHAFTVAKRRKEYLFAVLFLDLDRFKVVNDSLGHAIGDRLLIAIARRLEKSLHPGDTVARLGGDEFVILLEDIDSLSSATNLANLLHQELTSPFTLDEHEVFITLSIGIALSSLDCEDAANLLRDADTAMYRAKERGRARHEVFNTSMHAQALRLLQIENDLRKAIETIKKEQQINTTTQLQNPAANNNKNQNITHSQIPITNPQFLIHYQPIVSLSTGKITGFEALIRLQHPERGLISPAEFIPVAEETGLIIPIGQWVLRESCRQIRQWQHQFPHHQPLTISVNLSVKQFSQPNLIAQIDQILRETDLDGRDLKLEITESVLMENSKSVTALLRELRARNIHLCIDDFGTGYSSLSYLHRFPTNTLKIDRSFVSRMGIESNISKGNIDPTEIVRSIVTLAHNLGMDVVAEGVEKASQLALLRALKCDYGQGYFFSRPVDGSAAAALITKDEWGFERRG